MKRRGFIAAAIGGSVVAFAGCTGGADGDDDTETPTQRVTSRGGAPSIADRSFTRTGDAPTQRESASVSFGDETVTCIGVIEGRNGCMAASLKAARYDAEADELRVRVTTRKEGGDVCTQQLVYRGYEAVVAFDGGLPGSVLVEYESMGGTRTITEATR